MVLLMLFSKNVRAATSLCQVCSPAKQGSQGVRDVHTSGSIFFAVFPKDIVQCSFWFCFQWRLMWHMLSSSPFPPKVLGGGGKERVLKLFSTLVWFTGGCGSCELHFCQVKQDRKLHWLQDNRIKAFYFPERSCLVFLTGSEFSHSKLQFCRNHIFCQKIANHLLDARFL